MCPRLYNHLKGREEVHSQVCLIPMLCLIPTAVVYSSECEWFKLLLKYQVQRLSLSLYCFLQIVLACMQRRWVIHEGCRLWNQTYLGSNPQVCHLTAVYSWSNIPASLDLSSFKLNGDNIYLWWLQHHTYIFNAKSRTRSVLKREVGIMINSDRIMAQCHWARGPMCDMPGEPPCALVRWPPWLGGHWIQCSKGW